MPSSTDVPFPTDCSTSRTWNPAAPVASIVICNYNYGRYLHESVSSALSQTVPCQVIVVDDGSTDDSGAVLESLDPRVEVVRQCNGGQLAAYNAGFDRVRTGLVAFLDADDALEPDAIELAQRRFTDGVVKVHFRLRLVDESGVATGGTLPSALAAGNVLGPLLRHGLLYPSAPGSGNVYQRAALARLFPLPAAPDDRVGADFFTIYGCVAFGQVAACEEVLGRYRLHRRPAQAAEPLVFGNAALGNDESAKVAARYARLVALVGRSTTGAVRYPDRFLDFSVLKASYAMGIFAKGYWQALFSSGEPLRRLLKSMWLESRFSTKKKLGLSAWSLLVLLAPRSTGVRLARYVCNPASRGS